MINFFFRLKNRKVNKNAFTIAEMLISIAIIGILASISVPNMRKWVEKERQNAYLRELISYLELVKKETLRWNGRCTLQTNTRLRNSIDPVTSKHIGFKAFNVNCYDMNDSEIKNIQSRVPLIEHKVFQEVNLQTFNFTPREIFQFQLIKMIWLLLLEDVQMQTITRKANVLLYRLLWV